MTICGYSILALQQMCLGTVNPYLTLNWRLMLVVYVQIPNRHHKSLYFIVRDSDWGTFKLTQAEKSTKYEDTKEVIRNCKSKDRPHNSQNKKDKNTNSGP